MRLTERKIQDLYVEGAAKDRLVFDDVQRGLAVRITASGVTCMALFVPSELIEIGLDKELGYAEEEADAGADSDAATAD